MKKLFIAASIFLSGCVGVPVKTTFPNVPDELLKECPELIEISPNTTKLSDTIAVITENYGLYHECRIKSQLWVEWYVQQKQIYNDIK